MVFLCLAILSSCAISLLMRFSTNRVSARLSMLSVNYLICSLLGAAYAGFDVICPDVPGFSTTVALGVLGGILFLVSFVLLQWNTARNGIVLSSVFMKLGLLVPITLSALFFHEYPTHTQSIGFWGAAGDAAHGQTAAETPVAGAGCHPCSPLSAEYLTFRYAPKLPLIIHQRQFFM